MIAARARIIRRAVAQFCKNEKVPNELQHRLYRRAKRHWARHKKLPGFHQELQKLKKEMAG